MFEHLDQPVAQAFRVLPGQVRHVPHVRMGERDDRAVVVHELAGDAGLRHAEIDLRDAGAQTSSPYPSEPLRFASRQRLTYPGVVVYSPSYSVSARSLSCTRLAVWRCLRGGLRSASSHPSTNAAYGSILEPRRLSVGGFGVMSSMSAYFATVARSTSGLLAISDLDTP